MTLASANLLQERAAMFRAVRDFFFERGVLEVDVPTIVKAPIVDQHIEPMRIEEGFLITSPEAGMKRLLAKGSGDIYQISHVFRKGEKGKLHHPEFTMIEWYRVGMPYETFIEETLQLISLFLGKKEIELLTYKQAFLHFLKIDPLTATRSDLLALPNLPKEACEWEKVTLLHYLMSFAIEPQLDPKKFTIITDFPKSEAALAKTVGPIAKRFEIYHGGLELANGYDELTDANELRRRFEATNAKRENPLPYDTELLTDMEEYFPECCGVAVGFDRLLMLKLNVSTIQNVLGD